MGPSTGVVFRAPAAGCTGTLFGRSCGTSGKGVATAMPITGVHAGAGAGTATGRGGAIACSVLAMFARELVAMAAPPSPGVVYVGVVEPPRALMLVDSLPTFFRHIYSYIVAVNQQGNEYVPDNKGWLFYTLIQSIVAYLLMTNSRTIVSYINKNIKNEEN
ncbi:hypothetical protein EON66_01330 [archaeon]|nr:MAG: hypothetical protein EON66_01330 [archaeon]